MRRMTVLLVLLALLVSAAAVVAATDITVDGNGSEWAWSDYQGSDDNEAEVPDQYDIGPAYATMDVDDGGHCIRIDTAANLYLNRGTYYEVYFDTDNDPSGDRQECQAEFGDIGADSYIYAMVGQMPLCGIFEYDTVEGWEFVSNSCSASPTGPGQKGGNCVEICGDAGDLGIQGDTSPTIKVFFENGDSAANPPPDDIFCFTQTPEDGGGQGCTPGYWKQKQHFDSWKVYLRSDLFSAVFEVDCENLACADKTLLQALGTGGGGEKALMRHAVAALLNTAAGGVSYEYNVTQIKAMVQHAYETGDFEGIKNLFEPENEQGCPLD